jgi:hypothetical protein
MGGMTNAVGQSLVNSGMRMGGKAPLGSQGAAEYTPAQTRPTYNPAFSSQQTAQPVIQGLPQQMVPQVPQAPQSMQGLQGLMSQMMNRYQNPRQMQQRAPMPMTMPQYRNAALNYRPDITSARQALNRVSPSVELQQRQAAEAAAAEAARLQAEQEAAAQQSQYDSYYYGGG